MNIKAEQLILGFLKYGFDRVDLIDIKILEKMFLEKNPNVNIENICDKLISYIKVVDLRIYKKREISKFRFRPLVKKFFENFDIKYFMLLKIDALKGVKEQEINNNFGIWERKYLLELEFRGLLDVKKIEDGNILVLSDFSKLKLLKEDKNSLVSKFYEEARKFGVEEYFVDKFLIDKDIDFDNFSYANLDLGDLFRKYELELKRVLR